jgi:hypothetical protein
MMTIYHQVHLFDVNVSSLYTYVNDTIGVVDTYASPHYRLVLHSSLFSVLISSNDSNNVKLEFKDCTIVVPSPFRYLCQSLPASRSDDTQPAASRCEKVNNISIDNDLLICYLGLRYDGFYMLVLPNSYCGSGEI